MKEFRFAWNGRVYSKKETNMILVTMIAAIVPVIIIAVVICDLVEKLR